MELVLYKSCFQVDDARTTETDLIIKGMAKEKSPSVWDKLKKMLSSVWEMICNGKVGHQRKSKAQEVQDVSTELYILRKIWGKRFLKWHKAEVTK